jgi:signal transduction histidine kinase
MEHLVKGFAARAVDYVTKPFNPPELLARVRTHLELQHARQRLREMNDEKNEFLGIAAHDLRNPLTAIEGFSEVLCDDADLTPEELKDYAGRIRESAKRMREMVQNLLDANRIERGDMQLTLAPTDVGAVLKSVMEAYRPRAAAKQQVLHLDCEVASVAAIADRNVMVQVLENLVSNAVKYSPSGRNIWIRLRKSAAAVRCEVEDEGPGFKRGRSKEALRQIRAAQRKAHRWRTSHRAGSVDRQTNGGSHAGAGLVRE